jgi:hypothetical protein
MLGRGYHADTTVKGTSQKALQSASIQHASFWSPGSSRFPSCVRASPLHA